MNEDALRKAIRSGGCRLCLAPDTECVPIFATAAADKEPLSNKILSCVNIKVSDNMPECLISLLRNHLHWCVSATREREKKSNRNLCEIREIDMEVRATYFMIRKKVKISVWDSFWFWFFSSIVVYRHCWWLSISVPPQLGMVCVPIRIN